MLQAIEPNWSAMPPVMITGQASLAASGDVVVPTDAGAMAISALATGFRLRMGDRNQPVYPILVGEPARRSISLSQDADAIHLHWDDFVLKLARAPLAFDLARTGQRVLASADDGHFVRQHRLPPFARTAGGWFAAFALASGQPVYGLGEHFGRLDKRGSLVRSHVLDALGVNCDRSYKPVPFAWGPGQAGRPAWGLFAHGPSDVIHGIGHALWSHRSYAIAVDDAELDLFVLSGRDGAEILRAYTDLTGRAPEPPPWSLGTILSKAYYRTADELLDVAREVRARKMPCDIITFDGRAWQDTDTRFHFEFDAKRYPNPKAVIDELKAMDFRICVWEYPLVSVHGSLFAMMEERGWLLKDRRNGAAYRYHFESEPFGKVLTQLPDSGLVDFTHPDAYDYWRDQHQPLFELGIDMVKSDFGEQVEADCIAHNGDAGRRLHNAYPLLYNKCVHEAGQLYARDGAFLFGRAGWAGSQRYPVQWGGDPQADWEGLAASIRGGLSWGLSGGPFHAHDIGGFYRDKRDAELYVRWTQAAIFFSHLRFHGIGAREPWAYGAEAEAAVMQALALRQRLIPYLWAAVQEAARSGLPVQRAMVLAFPDERAAWAFEEQWMCGPDILVAPVLQAGGAVEVYLPQGDWLRLLSGEVVQGGRALQLTLALADMAVFVRATRTGNARF